MKRRLILTMALLCIVCSFKNVCACGEIIELKSSIGTVASLGSGRYVVTVPEGTKEITLEGTTEAKWVEEFAPRKVSTQNGSVELRVDGRDCGGSVYSYTIEFKELSNKIAENDSSQTTTPTPTPVDDTPIDNKDQDSAISEPSYGVLTLSKLEITGIDFTFDKDTHTYDLEYSEATNRLTINAVATDTTSKVSISENAYDLKQGENKITISLEDAYGNTGLYVLNIEKIAAKSPNNFLASLTISNYQLNFDPSITTYTIEIGKEKSLNVKPVTESELAKVEILGNDNLEDGSSLIVRVTAENGTTKDYVITVKRSFNIMDYWIYIVVGLLVILLILLLLITKQKKNKKKKSAGPDAVENNTTTAGVVQDATPQSQGKETLETFSSSKTDSPQTLSGAASSLKIIEPTNLEQDSIANETTVDEEKSPTEVFQL